jgi:NADH-ubiquinone oxidoreductase chain 4
MIVTILGSLGMVLGASYGLYLYNRVSFGSWSSYLRGPVRDITRREWHLLWPLMLWTLVLGLYPNGILEWLNGSVLNLLEYTIR